MRQTTQDLKNLLLSAFYLTFTISCPPATANFVFPQFFNSPYALSSLPIIRTSPRRFLLLFQATLFNGICVVAFITYHGNATTQVSPALDYKLFGEKDLCLNHLCILNAWICT